MVFKYEFSTHFEDVCVLYKQKHLIHSSFNQLSSCSPQIGVDFFCYKQYTDTFTSTFNELNMNLMERFGGT